MRVRFLVFVFFTTLILSYLMASGLAVRTYILDSDGGSSQFFLVLIMVTISMVVIFTGPKPAEPLLLSRITVVFSAVAIGIALWKFLPFLPAGWLWQYVS